MSLSNVVKKKPGGLKNLVGVNMAEFDQLYQKLVPLWTDSECKRLNRPNRQRAVGGGHPYTLELKDQLLMTLLWLQLHLNTAALSSLFGVDKATVSRNTRRVWQVLSQLGEPGLNWPQPPRRGQGKNLEQACRDYPDLLAMIERLEQASPSPSVPNQQHPHASGKQRERWLIYGLPSG